MATTSFLVAVENIKVTPQPPLSKLNTPAHPAAPHERCAPDHSPAPLPFSGFSAAPQCLSCHEGPRTGDSTQAVASLLKKKAVFYSFILVLAEVEVAQT